MKLFSEATLAAAEQLVAASKVLDYQRIVEHQPAEVAHLHRVLAELNIERRITDDAPEDYAAMMPSSISETREGKSLAAEVSSLETHEAGEGVVEADRLAIYSGIMESLSADGLEGRVDMVYNSASNSRTSQFDGVHHHRGIPEFNVVIAPDYAPVPGMHGVFISGTEVMSIILPSGDPAANWQVVKRKGYSDPGQMMEYLALISAGFDLPEE